MQGLLLTWACYGTRLPGQPGVVTRNLNQFGGPLPNPDDRRANNVRMVQHAYVLDIPRSQIVLTSLQDVCEHRRWTLWAAHVRTNHVHVVVGASCQPEIVMNTLKAYSSRALNQSSLDDPGRRRWARHGSTRYLWTADALSAAIHYVVHEQGEPMAVFENTEPRR